MYDVIVVGARCAGSSIATLLGRFGHRVLLLDRDTFPSDMEMSTHLVHQRGVACLNHWGLRDRLVDTMSPPIAHYDIDLGPVVLSGCPPAVDGEAFAFAPRRILLDDLLLRVAVEGGAEFREGCLVDGLLFEDDGVVGVTGKTSQGTSFSESGRLVIGADGPSSRVASLVGAEEYNAKPALQGTAWIYWDGRLTDRVELYLGPFEAIYAIPTSKSCTIVGANWSMDKFRTARAQIEASYLELLGRLAPHLADRAASTRRADDRVRLGSTRNFFRKAHGPGWVLLGDAHYTKDPCTAQGITDAFCDAQALAEAIHKGFSGERDFPALMSDYEESRVEWAMPFYELTCQFATFSPPPPQMQALYRALEGNQADIDRFIGLITEATSPAEFFVSENIQRILARSDVPRAGAAMAEGGERQAAERGSNAEGPE